jgi:hypothetical protein
MAKKISQLTQATQVKSDDVTVIVQDGETKKLPLNMMVTKQDIENKKVAGLAKLDEIEATYENDTYTPTITVKNKSSVKVGEGDGVDYSANVMDGPAKSAILKGNTTGLETNLFDGEFIQGDYASNGTFTGGTSATAVKNKINVVENKDYLLSYTKEAACRVTFMNGNTFISSNLYSSGDTKITIPNLCNNVLIHFGTGIYDNTIDLKFSPMFLTSVKMPVLTTVGKNLFDESQEPEQLGWGDNVKKANVKENTTYVYSSSPYTGYVTFKFYDNNDNEIVQEISIASGTSFTTPPNTSYLKTQTSNTSLVQIEEGTQATSYEPYKSNILTVNEPVELRGIGDVQDTLDCLTGEYTKAIYEYTFTGDESWQISGGATGGYSYFSFPSGQLPIRYNYKNDINVPIFCNRLPIINHTDLDSGLKNVGINLSYSFRLNFSDCNSNNGATVEDLRAYLKANPTTVQYPISKSIKTVDLMPSGTHPSTTPYCWKNGHIQLSSSGLLPNLEYSVVTSRAGQINQNATMIVKNDKRIFDLEILLAGGLVNTTYQALTLQNQVETGLSKVSLSSETEPDYLLYHMIMKLIEEKAYKLDDLTEKVSVFYLYEKLSDEQFETIYSALYPFAEDEYFESDIPGDDEVIEEPIVDESLEEVEDEVVM